jgi:hypothetical protein
MTETGGQSETDTFWQDVSRDDVEISTTLFIALIILIAFSLDVIGFEWALIAMLGLIATSGATG